MEKRGLVHVLKKKRSGPIEAKKRKADAQKFLEEKKERYTKRESSRRDSLLRYSRQVWRLVEEGLGKQSTSGHDEVHKREGDRNNDYLRSLQGFRGKPQQKKEERKSRRMLQGVARVIKIHFML